MSRRRSWTLADKSPDDGDDENPLFPRKPEPEPKPDPKPITPFERGMAASDAAAEKWSDEEKDRIQEAIRTLAARGQRFTSDAIWALVPDLEIGKGIGGQLNRARRRGIIRSTGDFGISTRGGRADHGQRLTVWIGT